MSFCFGFNIGEDESGEKHVSTQCAGIPIIETDCVDTSKTNSMTCEIYCPSVGIVDCNDSFVDSTIGGVILSRVVVHDSGDSDLISGSYEGGLKLWECSIDLLKYYLHQHSLHGGTVLELGCGHGLPGIAALLKGASQVVFSDFNSDVLLNVTWPNIVRNCGPMMSQNARCIAGDWSVLSHNMINKAFADIDCTFDLILSAETLYTLESTAKVHDLIKTHLCPGGVAIIATKRYYFGVGGGSMELLRLISRDQDILTAGRLRAKVVAVFEDGSSNTREIIEIRKE